MSATIRLYRPEDRDALLGLHERHGRDLWFADPSHGDHFVTIVAEDGGAVVAAASGVSVVEAFLMIDPDRGTPLERWELVRELVSAGAAFARMRGVTQLHLHTHLPRFADRLQALPNVVARAKDDHLVIDVGVC